MIAERLVLRDVLVTNFITIIMFLWNLLGRKFISNYHINDKFQFIMNFKAIINNVMRDTSKNGRGSRPQQALFELRIYIYR